MHRFHLPPEQCQGDSLTLTAREAHHALHVVRLRPGERVSVLDGVGQDYECEVRAASRHSVTLAVSRTHSRPRLPCQLTLLQALPKGKVFETIVQKATELGAFRVVPLLTERVVSHPGEEAVATKVEKWRLIAVDSIKQCGSTWLPQIEAPVSLRDYLARGERFELLLVASLHRDQRHLRVVLEEFRQARGQLPRSVGVFVGPEGDFTPSEMEAIQASGALPITLGTLVLRCDTAAVCALAVLNYELQSPAPSAAT